MNNHEEKSSFDKKRFLFVSYDALISDVAWHVAKEGHEVKYYIKNEKNSDSADGLVPKVSNWENEVAWADLVVFDDVLGMGKMAEKVRASGKLVVGGTTYTDMLEDDRSFGQEEMKKNGIGIIPYETFTDFDTAINYVKANPGKYVIKPSGEAQGVKRFLYVGQEDDGRDIIQVLELYKNVWSKVIKVFQLQKKVSGVEVGVSAFFNGYEFIYPINVNFEHKRLFPQNIGPSTGEMGTSMFWSMPNKIFNTTLLKMQDVLRREHYVGVIDLNCIVNNNGVYPLEFTARFGYPTIQIQQEGLLMPIGEILYTLADGSLKKFKTRSGFQVGVRLVIPPFPYGGQIKNNAISSKDTLIIFKKEGLEGVHIEDVKQLNNEWLVAGSSGVTFVIVGTGPTMMQAQQQAYHRIQNILIPNMFYRDDIGDRWNEDSDKLHNWGYLRE